MPPREIFTASAREALMATGIYAGARARFEALLLWEIRMGLIAAGETRVICIGHDWLEFTFNDQKQVVDVRLGPQQPAEDDLIAESPEPEGGSGR